MLAGLRDAQNEFRSVEDNTRILRRSARNPHVPSRRRTKGRDLDADAGLLPVLVGALGKSVANGVVPNAVHRVGGASMLGCES